MNNQESNFTSEVSEKEANNRKKSLVNFLKKFSHKELEEEQASLSSAWNFKETPETEPSPSWKR